MTARPINTGPCIRMDPHFPTHSEESKDDNDDDYYDSFFFRDEEDSKSSELQRVDFGDKWKRSFSVLSEINVTDRAIISRVPTRINSAPVGGISHRVSVTYLIFTQLNVLNDPV